MANFMPSFYSEIYQSLLALTLVACEFLEDFLQSAQQPPFQTSFASKVQRVVWLPQTELLLKSHQRGKIAINKSDIIFPLMPSAFISRMSSVLTTPGCRLAAIPLSPILSASALVNKTLYNFDLEYATFGSQFLSKLMFSQSGLGSPPKPSNLLCASDDTLIILNLSEALSLFHRREVRQKWPRWLTPHCIQKPSFVVLRCGRAIMPALLTRQSRRGKETLLTKVSMELRLARSREMNSTFAFGCSFLIDLITSYAVYLLLAPIITSHPNLVSSRTVSAPMPEFPPVTTAYLPVRSGLGPLYCVPLKYCLRASITATMTAVIIIIC